MNSFINLLAFYRALKYSWFLHSKKKHFLYLKKPHIRDLGVLNSDDLYKAYRNVTRHMAVCSVSLQHDPRKYFSTYTSLLFCIVEPAQNNGHSKTRKYTTFTAQISDLRNGQYWYLLKHLSLMSLQRRRERYMPAPTHP